MGLLSIVAAGRTSLTAAQTGLDVVQQNISNALTPGYARRRAALSAPSPIRVDGMLLGRGVALDGLRRSGDNLLLQRRAATVGAAAEADEHATWLREAEALLDDPATIGIRERLDGFFDALSDSDEPSSAAYRTQVATATRDMADELRRAASRLTGLADSAQDALRGPLPEINSALEEVASLNRRIVAAGGVNAAPDLADRRQQLIDELGESIGATMAVEGDQIHLFIGGHAAVHGGVARELSFEDGPSVRISVDSGEFDLTESLGGRLGGIAEAWQDIEDTLTDLDTFVTDFVAAVNTQHQAGFDANGNAGGDLFEVGALRPSLSIRIVDAVFDDPDLLAFAGSATAEAGDNDNLLALADLEQVLPTGDAPGARLTAIVTETATRVVSAQDLAQRSITELDDLESILAQRTGVDLDEEAGQLILWQTAYQASAQVVQAADRMLNVLMEIA